MSENEDKVFLRGVAAYRGDDGPRDFDDAAECFHEAAVRGHAGAQYLLAICYQNGYGVPTNEGMADNLLRKAAKQGHVDARRHLANRYWEGNEYGDAVKGVEAAEQGDAKAQLYLGDFYNMVEDSAEARRWYLRAAEGGLADAQYIVANFEGEYYGEARKWCRIAAMNGHADAQFMFGTEFKETLDGESWKEWIEKSAAQGNEKAISLLDDLDSPSATSNEAPSQTDELPRIRKCNCINNRSLCDKLLTPDDLDDQCEACRGNKLTLYPKTEAVRAKDAHFIEYCRKRDPNDKPSFETLSDYFWRCQKCAMRLGPGYQGEPDERGFCGTCVKSAERAAQMKAAAIEAAGGLRAWERKRLIEKILAPVDYIAMTLSVLFLFAWVMSFTDGPGKIRIENSFDELIVQFFGVLPYIGFLSIIWCGIRWKALNSPRSEY